MKTKKGTIKKTEKKLMGKIENWIQWAEQTIVLKALTVNRIHIDAPRSFDFHFLIYCVACDCYISFGFNHISSSFFNFLESIDLIQCFTLFLRLFMKHSLSCCLLQCVCVRTGACLLLFMMDIYFCFISLLISVIVVVVVRFDLRLHFFYFTSSSSFFRRYRCAWCWQ